MKRFLYLIIASLVVALILFSEVSVENKAHAQSLSNLQQLQQKISTDLLQKVLAGKLFESVRVVIQPAGQSDSLLDPVIGLLGGTDVRKLNNLRMRVATLEVRDV